MRKIVDRIRSALGRTRTRRELTNVTKETEKDAVIRRLVEQRIRFERMGIEVDTRVLPRKVALDRRAPR